MSWQIEYDARAVQELRKLDHSIRREIVDYMERRIGKADDPRQLGKPLRGSRFGLWRYRLRDYRIVCELQGKRLVVFMASQAPYSLGTEPHFRAVVHHRYFCFAAVRLFVERRRRRFPRGGRLT